MALQVNASKNTSIFVLKNRKILRNYNSFSELPPDIKYISNYNNDITTETGMESLLFCPWNCERTQLK